MKLLFEGSCIEAIIEEMEDFLIKVKPTTNPRTEGEGSLQQLQKDPRRKFKVTLSPYSHVGPDDIGYLVNEVKSGYELEFTKNFPTAHDPNKSEQGTRILYFAHHQVEEIK